MIDSLNVVCDQATCDNSTSDTSNNDSWDESSSEEIWGWLKTQLRKDLMTFCKDGSGDENDKNLNRDSLSMVEKIYKCEKFTTEFKGNVDKNGWPKSKGVLQALYEREFKPNLRSDG